MAESTWQWGKTVNSLGLSNAQTLQVGAGILDFGSTITGMIAQSQRSKAKSAYQAYTNSMVQLSAGVQADAITMNEILMNKASAEKASSIQKQGMTAFGAAEVSAAAAGVTGNSVNVTKAHIEGNAAAAEVQRQREYKFSILGFDQQRKNVAVNASVQKDYSDYSTGSAAGIFGSLIGGAGKIMTALGAF